MSDVNQDFAPVCESRFVFIPVIDASAGMAGEPIAAINEIMADLIGYMADLNEHHLECDFCIAPLVYADHATWWGYTNDTLISADEYVWQDIQPSGMSRMTPALDMLLSKLTTKEGGWMEKKGGIAPIIVFFMGRTPGDNYRVLLEKLFARGWYKAAFTFGVVMKDPSVLPVLVELTGNIECVFDINNIEQFGVYSALENLVDSCLSAIHRRIDVDPVTGYTTIPNGNRVAMDDTDDIF